MFILKRTPSIHYSTQYGTRNHENCTIMLLLTAQLLFVEQNVSMYENDARDD